MAIIKMQKISIISLNSLKEQVFKMLQEKKLIQIIENEKDTLEKVIKDTKTITQYEDLEKTIDEIKYAIDFSDKYFTGKKPSMLQSFISDKTDIEYKKYLDLKKIPYKDIIEKIKKIDEKLVLNENNISKNDSLVKLLVDFKWINIPIKDLESLNNFSYIIGRIQNQYCYNFNLDLNKNLNKKFLLKTNSHPKNRFTEFLLVYEKNKEEIIEKINKKYSIEKTDFLNLTDLSPQELYNNTNKGILSLKKEKNKLIKDAQILSKNKLNFMCLYDTYLWKFSNLYQQNKTENSNYTFTISGWIAENKIKTLKANLRKITNFYEIINLEIKKDEEVPILLENPNYLKPFEAVTNIYGMPKYNEPDPTGYLAIFFIIFFGLCLTDAGYGLIIIILTFIMLKYVNLPDKKLVTLLNIGGWTTFIIGALTGGWFGIDLDTLSYRPLANVLTSFRLINPIANPMVIMGIALALGIIQVWYGIVVKFRWKIKNNNKKEAIYDDAPWILLIPSLIFFALVKTNVLANDLSFFSTIFLLISLFLVILSKSRHQKNILLKLPIGILGLYDMIGYLSDTLSYSRLLALGLATGVIGLVVNMIASLFGKVPYVGWLIFIIILIGGHTFNIAINLLGAFIHSARLQYVEFFNKFLEGGGKKFDPFSKKNTYINLKNN